MLHLPKFVRERMKASVSPVGHPDPDVLTAFSERSLPAHERAAVLEHVSRCAECRDVLALTLPAIEPVTAPVLAQRNWFRWPVLRWSAVAAGIVIIAAIGIQQYRQHHEPMATLMARTQVAEKIPAQDQLTRNEASKAEMPASAAEAKPAAPSQPGALPTRQGPSAESEGGPSEERETSQLHIDARAKAGAAAGGFVESPTLGGAIARGQAGGIGSGAGAGTKFAMNAPPKPLFDDSAASATRSKQLPTAPAPKAVVPSSSEMVEVQAAAPAIATQNQVGGQRQDQQLDYYRPQQQPSGAELNAENDKTLSKAKQATQQVEVGAVAGAAFGTTPAPQPALVARNLAALPPPIWSITAAGGLQRSFDSGKTWHDVNVNSYPAPVSVGQTAESVMVTAQAPTVNTAVQSDIKKKDRALRKAPAPSMPVFRAVAANGPDVWAGGSAGVLYHSIDAGDHWTRIFPLAGSTPLTADITSVQFSDSQHGTLTTATSETWTTADAGLSWQKR